MQTTVDDRTRTRLRWVLFAAVGSMTTGYIAAVTVATLAARSITGSELLAGVPGSLAVISTAVGTSFMLLVPSIAMAIDWSFTGFVRQEIAVSITNDGRPKVILFLAHW